MVETLQGNTNNVTFEIRTKNYVSRYLLSKKKENYTKMNTAMNSQSVHNDFSPWKTNFITKLKKQQ